MPHCSDENLFAAFQSRRDCAALGALFRRRADELLRLAVFLAPRPCDAEDLVQATFLSAIARAETWKRGSRVMSWLCGILTNHARMLRRAARRTPPAAAGVDSDDPADAALRTELREALASAIAGLAEPYRSVVALHLEDGLDSVEISRRLARPPATVRKQMERALDRLRTALPLGLATAFAARVDAQALARNAADAARFVEPTTMPLAPRAHTVLRAARTPRAAAWLVSAIGAAVAVTLGAPWLQQPAAGGTEHVRDLASAAPRVASAVVTAAAVVPLYAAPDRAPAPGAAPPELVVHAVDAAGAPVAGFDVLVIADDGRALPERLLSLPAATARTDRDGVARFPGLARGRHDVAWPGAVAKRNVVLGDGEQRCELTVPPAVELKGTVQDGDGRPVAGAEILVSESSLRGDLGTPVAHTGADGAFTAAVRVASGRVFARHAQYGCGVGVRPETDRVLRLLLPNAQRTIDVAVRDAQGRALPGAYVALVPRSFATALYPPQHVRCDEAGTCRLGDPGPREATVLAIAPGLAPGALDLPPDATSLELTLVPGCGLRGVLADEAGAPLANRLVIASVADQRSNEPVAPLLARAARTAADGSFAFEQLPRGTVQVRAHGDTPSAAAGLVPFPHVLAARDVDVDGAPAPQLALTARFGPVLRGRLATPAGRGVAGWNVLAVPTAATALHRAFRGRGTVTAADGTFEIRDLAAGESYQLGAFAGRAARGRDGGFPRVCGIGRPDGEPVTLTVDPDDPPRARLRCRVLAPSGQPFAGAELELRAVAFHGPMSRSAADDGSCEFGPLVPGRYWLAIVAPGLGTRTVVVDVAAGQELADAGTITLQHGSRAQVRVHDAHGAVGAGARVVAQAALGDKFVSAATDARGVAVLPVMPPGTTRLLVHGPGIAPVQRVLALEPGAQVVDVEVEPARTVPMRATFPLADNPFSVNGPLHVVLTSDDGALVLEDFVGAVSERGTFDLTTGLPPGRYRVVARALWNARAEAAFVVPARGDPAAVELRLAR